MLKKIEEKQVKMLKLLNEYLTIAEIANLMNKSPKTIYKAFLNYRKKGWINQDRTLTTFGFQKVEKAIAISKKVEFKPNSIRLHNLVFTVDIPKINKWDQKEKYLNLKNISFKTINLGTWKTQQIVIDNRKIWLNPQKIRFYMGEYYADTSLDAFSLALEELKVLIKKVEKLLNIKIIHNNCINFSVPKQHYALIKNKLAEQYNKDKKKLFIYDSENRLRILIDDSWGLKEFEHVNNTYSREDADKTQPFFNDILERRHFLPSEVKVSLQATLDVLNEQSHAILNITKILESQYKPQKEVPKEMKGGVPDYVG